MMFVKVVLLLLIGVMIVGYMLDGVIENATGVAFALMALMGVLLLWRWPRTKTTIVNHLIPGPDDEPQTAREVFVSGITRTGLCGIPRQDLIRKCSKGEPIYLVRQPDNPHDENAVLLYRKDGTDIGYLPADTAAEIAPRLDSGSPVTAVFSHAEPFETDDGRMLLGGRIEITPHRIKRRKSKG
jgi:hypothetical protein